MGVLSGEPGSKDPTVVDTSPTEDDAPEPTKAPEPVIEDVPKEPSRRTKAKEADEALKSEVASLREKATRFEEIDKERGEMREKLARLEGEVTAARAQAARPSATEADRNYADKMTNLRQQRWDAYSRNDPKAVDAAEDAIIELKADRIAEAKMVREREARGPDKPAWLNRLENDHPEVAADPAYLADVESKYRALLRGGKMPGPSTAKEAFQHVEKFHSLKAPDKPKTGANSEGKSFAGVDSKPATESAEESVKVELPANWEKIAKGFGMSPDEYKRSYAASNPHKVRRSA